ncbi:Ldh family oxidoreductase [Agromyces sp. NPDC060279]|uniref:Ldh family oxidoreductase n=1 Tax=Agromyces sp. NPDC060279 TaxID=3347092 RepID=UPI003654C7FD
MSGSLDAGAAQALVLDRLRGAAPDAPLAELELASRWLVEAELLGLPDFGIGMLRRDLDRLTAGPSAAERAEPPVTASAPATASIDATGRPGIVALARATESAAQRAAANGSAVVGIRGAGALGVLGLAARGLAEQGLVAVIAAQAPPIVAPWGGTQPVVGTNPIAIAVPRPDTPPLVVDYATAPATMAALRRHRADGSALPAGLAIDAEGAETTDASRLAALVPTSLLGSLTGLVVELLAGVVTGGRGAADGTRGAILIAVDAGGTGAADVAAGAARFADEWRAAGGHLPARFDALPPRTTALAGRIALDGTTTAWLDGIDSTGGAR